MKIKITGIIARGEREVVVCFEMQSDDAKNIETKKFLISGDQLARLQLARGDANEEIFDLVALEARIYGAVKKGLKTLEYGYCSTKALYLKLLRAGFSKDISAKAVVILQKQKLLDDKANARREAEKGVKKLWGSHRIESELLKKGYDSDCAKDALEHLNELGVDYAANCEKLVAMSLQGETPTIRDLKRLYPSLTRYGYSSSEIKTALVSVLGENE